MAHTLQPRSERLATGILTEQNFISECRHRVIESLFLVSVLFREVFSHLYISFFHLLVNGFCVIIKYLKLMMFSEFDSIKCSYAVPATVNPIIFKSFKVS